MKKINLFLVASLFAGLLQACHGTTNNGNTDSTTAIHKANDSTQLTTADTAKASSGSDDIQFANKAAIAGMAEVGLGKMAIMRTSNQKIREFAHMMVADHGKANTELIEIAKKKNITLPGMLDTEHQQMTDSISKLSGTDFARAYVNAMVEGHKKALALMQTEANNGKDADLKAFAAKTVPVIQMHLDAINKIHDQIK
jgi:putative membrane protein